MSKITKLTPEQECLTRTTPLPAAAEDGEIREPWNPDPGDPFWMVEVRQHFDGAGSWLKNEQTYLTTRDPIKALRYPSWFAADCARRRLPLNESGRFEPTEHLWINHSASHQAPAADALVEALEAITLRAPERDVKWAGMTARDIALFALTNRKGGA